MKYKTIVVDPPWPYRSERPVGATKQHRPNSYDSVKAGPSSAARYGSMSIAELKDLTAITPDTDAHLYLWTTNSFMEEAHELARAWGFAPKTILTWVKQKPDGTPSMKMGYYFRGATEHVLFAVRGSLRLTTSVAYPTAMLWPRLPHSQKPDAFYDLVESVSPGPYLDVFARKLRFHWDAWGDEVGT